VGNSDPRGGGSSSNKNDIGPSPHPNGNGVPSLVPSRNIGQDSKMMMMDKAKMAKGASSSHRDAKRLPELPKTCKIFQLIVNVERSLGEFRRLLIPAFVKVLMNDDVFVETRRAALCFLMHLVNNSELHQLAPKIVHPLIRVLGSKRCDSTLQATVVTALSCLLCRLGANFAPYVIPVRRKLRTIVAREGGRTLQVEEYDTLVARLLRQRSLPVEPATVEDLAIRTDDRVRARVLRDQEEREKIGRGKGKINIQSLANTWALAARNKRVDLIEWMRRLSTELTRQSPSQVIRYCSVLAKNYSPLAERLFNVSFISIWEVRLTSPPSPFPRQPSPGPVTPALTSPTPTRRNCTPRRPRTSSRTSP
jgi:FKBP12-rapamycin complex-associated protein